MVCAGEQDLKRSQNCLVLAGEVSVSASSLANSACSPRSVRGAARGSEAAANETFWSHGPKYSRLSRAASAQSHFSVLPPLSRHLVCTTVVTPFSA